MDVPGYDESRTGETLTNRSDTGKESKSIGKTSYQTVWSKPGKCRATDDNGTVKGAGRSAETVLYPQWI